jgi:4-nitrophenyl phosphatase
MDFTTIKGVISDMDGVLWRGDEPLPGMHDLFAILDRRGIPIVLATNNSSKSQAEYVEKLSRMGVNGLAEQQIVTSGTATASYMQKNYPPGTPVYVLGGDGLRHILSRAGFSIVREQARVVVVGADFNLTYDNLKRATYLIRDGADFIGTNIDATFPMPDGLAPGAGTIIAAVATATGAMPQIIGKPGAAMFQAALEVLGTKAYETLMIGDRLNTDIEGAMQAGLKAALVLTGVTTRAELEASGAKPDGVFDGLPALLAAWK